MFFKAVDRSATKNEIRDALINIATDNGERLSKSRADKLANNFKKGHYDPELERVLQYSDPTGETAVSNILKGQAA